MGEILLGLFMLIGIPIFIIGLIIHIIYEQVRDYRRSQSRKKFLKKMEEDRVKNLQAARLAICPHCGQRLLTDYHAHNTCCYCGSEFSVETAKNFVRAEHWLNLQKYELALEYYRRILVAIPGNRLALEKIEETNTAKRYHVYIRTTVFHVFSKHETLEFRKKGMTYRKNKGRPQFYAYEDMDELEDSRGSFLFRYKENLCKEFFLTSVQPSIITSFIEHAKQGLYPPLDWKP